MLTTTDIIQQCVVSPYGLYPLDKKLYKKVWRAVGTHIEKQMLQGMGVNFIHFGQFTFKIERQFGTRRTLKIPSFIVSTVFAREHHVRYHRLAPHPKIKVKEVDIKDIAEISGQPTDKVYQVIQDILRCTGTNVHEQRSVMVDFGVGKLCVWTGYATVRFEQKFLRKVEALQAADRLRPGVGLASQGVDVRRRKPRGAAKADGPPSESGSWVVITKEQAEAARRAAHSDDDDSDDSSDDEEEKDEDVDVEGVEPAAPAVQDEEEDAVMEEADDDDEEEDAPPPKPVEAWGEKKPKSRRRRNANSSDGVTAALAEPKDEEEKKKKKKTKKEDKEEEPSPVPSTPSSRSDGSFCDEHGSIHGSDFCVICKSRSAQIGAKHHREELRLAESHQYECAARLEMEAVEEERKRRVAAAAAIARDTFQYNMSVASARAERRSKHDREEPYEDIILSHRARTPRKGEQAEAVCNVLEAQISARREREAQEHDELMAFENAQAEKNRATMEAERKARREKKYRTRQALAETWAAQIAERDARRKQEAAGVWGRCGKCNTGFLFRRGSHESELRLCRRCGNELPFGLPTHTANKRINKGLGLGRHDE